MKNKYGKKIPPAVLQSGERKFNWLKDIKRLSIGELVEIYAYSEAIVETVREPLVILDDKLHIKSANKAFFDKFKISKADTIGKYIYKLNSGEWNIPKLKKLLEDILPNSTYFNDFEVSHDFENIGKRIMLLNARRVVFENNKTQLILLAIEDVTVRKELETQKDTFLSIASHELKTPLSALKVYTEVMGSRLAKAGDSKNLYFIQKINNQVERIQLLVNDFLDANLIDAGKLDLNRTKFNLDKLITNLIVEFQFTTEHEILKKVSFKKEIVGDKERISQVLSNLLSNAIKYSPTKSKIIISASEKNGEILISVRDFGIGIAKDKQRNLFEKYYRIKQNITYQGRGFGLGLFIAANIIYEHGGKIWVESQQGKGSTFYFTLPQK